MTPFLNLNVHFLGDVSKELSLIGCMGYKGNSFCVVKESISRRSFDECLLGSQSVSEETRISEAVIFQKQRRFTGSTR